MNSKGFKRSGALIAAVLGGQTLALGIMLSAAYLLSSLDEPDQLVDVFSSQCITASADETPAGGLESRRLLNLSVGWLR